MQRDKSWQQCCLCIACCAFAASNRAPGCCLAHGTNSRSSLLAILAVLCSSHDMQGLATSSTAGVVPAGGPLSASLHTAISSAAANLGFAGSSMQSDSSAEVCSDSAALGSALPAAVRRSEPDTAVLDSSQTLLASVQPAEAAAADRGHDHQQDVPPQLCTSTAGHPDPELQSELENTAAASTSQEPVEGPEVIPHAALYWTFGSRATMAFAPCNISALYTKCDCNFLQTLTPWQT